MYGGGSPRLDETMARLHAQIAIAHVQDPMERIERIESAKQAAVIDARIERAYAGHPNRHFIESTQSFVSKMATATAWLDAWIPACCAMQTAKTSDTPV